MTALFKTAVGIPEFRLLRTAEDLPRLRVALQWMRELESSLQVSRKALLALDLAGIEQGTCEQVRLINALEGVLQRSAVPPEIPGRSTENPADNPVRDQPVQNQAAQNQPAQNQASGWPAGLLELEEELRRRGSIIREAARLQLALLARARCKLRILANMLAGPRVNYEYLAAGNGARLFLPGGRSGSRAAGVKVGGPDSCRA